MARRRRGGHGHQEESEERWLLTYADMITLLMALFMVLFSISSVNISKYVTLQKALRAAFSGSVLPGGKSIAHPGATPNSSKAPSAADLESIVPVTSSATSSQSSSAQSAASASTVNAAAAQHEASEFVRLKAEIEAYAKAHGFSGRVQATIEARGLVIRVLTDDLLFSSGSASLEARADGLLAEIAQLINLDQTHPVDVEGNTDDVPIHSGVYPSNWELSAARASMVVRFLIEKGVSPTRLTAVGYADQRPIASNLTPAGRARNRRVEIVLKRIYGSESEP